MNNKVKLLYDTLSVKHCINLKIKTHYLLCSCGLKVFHGESYAEVCPRLLKVELIVLLFLKLSLP